MAKDSDLKLARLLPWLQRNLIAPWMLELWFEWEMLLKGKEDLTHGLCQKFDWLQPNLNKDEKTSEKRRMVGDLDIGIDFNYPTFDKYNKEKRGKRTLSLRNFSRFPLYQPALHFFWGTA